MVLTDRFVVLVYFLAAGSGGSRTAACVRMSRHRRQQAQA